MIEDARINSFVEDLGLKEIIRSKYNISISMPDGSVTKSVPHVVKKSDVLERIIRNATKKSLSGELVGLIQVVRAAVYYATSAECISSNKELTTADKDAKLADAQKDFDKKLQGKLEDYLLEAEITNILGDAIKASNNKESNNTDQEPLSPEGVKIFVDVAKEFVYKCNADPELTPEKKKQAKREAIVAISEQRSNLEREKKKPVSKEIERFFLSEIEKHPINIETHKRFCDNIFSNAPNAKAEQILSLGGTPEIKRNVLVSFLRIILYPFKFIVNSMDKKRIYGLDKLRLFKDGKEEPRSAEDAKNRQQERLLDYNALDPGLGLQLQAVEIEKGKKQHYAVLDCFVGAEPPNGTLIVFHGKNADIHTKSLIDNYRSIGEGYRVIMMEYPGFEPSKGPLSKENISKVTHQLFEDAKSKGFIKGDVTVMGEDFGSYYAARLAKKIGEKEPKLCKGLMLSGSFDNTNNLSRSGKIASYISDAEQLNTGSVLQDLPRTMPLTLLSSDETLLDKLYPKKEELTAAPMPYYAEVLKIGEDGNNNKVLADGLENLRTNIKKSRTLIGGKTQLVDVKVTSVSKGKEAGKSGR